MQGPPVGIALGAGHQRRRPFAGTTPAGPLGVLSKGNRPWVGRSPTMRSIVACAGAVAAATRTRAGRGLGFSFW
ncbi:hypothetical protein GW17_00061545 [Ensete ventricosum]|nr:hypothetical protein GW17_00061545 [Ensete ventricosum]